MLYWWPWFSLLKIKKPLLKGMLVCTVKSLRFPHFKILRRSWIYLIQLFFSGLAISKMFRDHLSVYSAMFEHSSQYELTDELNFLNNKTTGHKALLWSNNWKWKNNWANYKFNFDYFIYFITVVLYKETAIIPGCRKLYNYYSPISFGRGLFSSYSSCKVFD